MMNIPVAIGAILILVSGIPYIVDIIRGKTRPNIVSWFTWTLLITIGAFAALDAGETATAILTFADAGQVGLILLLGLKYGYAKLSLFDGICQASALIGLGLWLLFNNPTIAIIASIVIDLIAALPTYRHSWLKPGEETWQTFFVSGIGAAVGLISLGALTVDGYAYPLYVMLLGLTLSMTIVIRRKQKKLPLFR
jgi:hypothetical protein